MGGTEYTRRMVEHGTNSSGPGLNGPGLEGRPDFCGRRRRRVGLGQPIQNYEPVVTHLLCQCVQGLKTWARDGVGVHVLISM